MIPVFNSAGVIPPYQDAPTHGERSPYPTHMVELCRVLGFNSERRKILRGLIAYREVLAAAGFGEGYQLINGSLLEDCEGVRGRPPGDADVFTYLELPEHYRLDSDLFNREGLPFLLGEAMGSSVKARHSIDAYLVVSPPGMSMSEFFHGFAYFTLLFSHQRVTEIWKGAVSLSMDNTAHAEALELLDALDRA